jgi:hypothetical protein
MRRAFGVTAMDHQAVTAMDHSAAASVVWWRRWR